MTLDEFNRASAEDAAATLTPCLDIPRWTAHIVAHRPYADFEALLRTARDAAAPFTREELEGAMRHHPRIGERAQGQSAEARLSSAEQAGLGASSAEIETALKAANAEYENKFGHIFLIRAAGRSRSEVLSELQRRMGNTEAQEWQIVGGQLREIALLRLEGIFKS